MTPKSQASSRVRLIVALVILLSLVACSTLPERVADLTSGNYFKQALSVIQKEEARLQQNPDTKGLNELAKSKDIFQKSIEDHYLPLIQDLEHEGRTYSAVALTRESMALCDWSTSLSDKLASLEKTTQAIEQLEAKWVTAIDGAGITVDSIEALKADLYPLKNKIADADKAKKLNSVLQDAVLARVINAIARSHLRSSAEELDPVISDVKSLETDRSNETAMVELLKLAYKIVNTDPASAPPENWADLYQTTFTTVDRERNQELLSAIRSAFEDWAVAVFGRHIAESGTAPGQLETAETFYSRVAKLSKSADYANELSHAHLLRAFNLNHGGVASIVAKLHLARGNELSSAYASQITSETEKADALLSKSQLPKTYLDFGINPTIPKDQQDAVFSNYLSDFLGHSRKGQPWTLDPAKARSVVKVYIDKARMIFPEMKDLREKASVYLDHFENVPNPQKEFLRSQLSWAESSVSQAKSSYEWAVSSYNINPTDFGLQQANNDYNAYEQAVNEYNRLVNEYNSEPSLVQKPVYLGYLYREGYWEYGYELSITLEVNGETSHYSSRSSDRAFVKLGTKYNDYHEDNRADVPWEFSFSVDSFLLHVNRVNSDLDRQIYPRLCEIAVESSEDLTSNEIRALNIVLNPWGYEPKLTNVLNVSGWATQGVRDPAVVTYATELPTTRIQSSTIPKARYSEARTLSKDLGDTVVLIENFSNGQLMATGSGTLIGPDGLILTCAHVIEAPDLRVLTPASGKANEIPVEVVFRNEKNDLALLRAKGLQNKKWANVRITGTTGKGERIVAIGNPSLGGTLLNLGGVTQGIVSNPSLDDEGQSRLVGDITIASGSSGGPIFSMETGELIAVVQAVTAIGLNQGGVSSSGYFALGAPSQNLTEWLGLKY